MTIDIERLANWLKSRGTDNFDSNSILDGLEELFQLETALAKHFTDKRELLANGVHDQLEEQDYIDACTPWIPKNTILTEVKN